MSQNFIRNKQVISHELLTAVLGFKAWQITGKAINWLMNIRDNDIVYEDRAENQNLIDIDYLGRLCKEWALSKGYYLRAEQGVNYTDNLMWVCFLNKDMNDGADFADYWNLTEVEAIFKACEWILEQIKIKGD